MHCKILVLLLVIAGTEAAARTCESPADCPRRAKCCRSRQGNTLPPQEGFFEIESLQTTGRCTSRLARKNEQCDPTFCRCAKGLECYRPITGVCCVPFQCYDAKWVKQQREFWENCFNDPNCHFPA